MEYAKNQPFFKQTQSNLRCVSNRLILLKHLQEMPGPFWLLVNMVWTFVKPLRDGAVPEGPFERGGETGGKIQVKSLTQSHICRLLLISREGHLGYHSFRSTDTLSVVIRKWMEKYCVSDKTWWCDEFMAWLCDWDDAVIDWREEETAKTPPPPWWSPAVGWGLGVWMGV